MIYNERIVYRVIRLFGIDSDIYKSLISGKEISKMIRQSFNKNGFRLVREREKKMLFEDCRKADFNYERITNLDFSL